MGPLTTPAEAIQYRSLIGNTGKFIDRFYFKVPNII